MEAYRNDGTVLIQERYGRHLGRKPICPIGQLAGRAGVGSSNAPRTLVAFGGSVYIRDDWMAVARRSSRETLVM
jgi:hypothetical protein